MLELIIVYLDIAFISQYELDFETFEKRNQDYLESEENEELDKNYSEKE